MGAFYRQATMLRSVKKFSNHAETLHVADRGLFFSMTMESTAHVVERCFVHMSTSLRALYVIVHRFFIRKLHPCVPVPQNAIVYSLQEDMLVQAG